MSFERFTDRSRKVMMLANQAAIRLNHEYIGTEHVLLGLLQEGSGVASNVLKNLDLSIAKLEETSTNIVQVGPGLVRVGVYGQLPQTPRTKKVLEYAVEEARTLGHNYVGTEHILLGLLRETEGVAGQVLVKCGCKIEDVREEVLNLLGHETNTTETNSLLSGVPAVVPMDGKMAEYVLNSITIHQLNDKDKIVHYSLLKFLFAVYPELVKEYCGEDIEEKLKGK